MGNLIPAGTGAPRCRRIQLTEPLELPEEAVSEPENWAEMPIEKIVDN
jgi:hypothetical protein